MPNKFRDGASIPKTTNEPKTVDDAFGRIIEGASFSHNNVYYQSTEDIVRFCFSCCENKKELLERLKIHQTWCTEHPSINLDSIYEETFGLH